MSRMVRVLFHISVLLLVVAELRQKENVHQIGHDLRHLTSFLAGELRCKSEDEMELAALKELQQKLKDK